MVDHFEGGDIKTAAKLAVLDDYLKPYIDIIKSNFGECWYIDTHAGTGKTYVNDNSLINGSAIRAIRGYAEDFDGFYLYEFDPDHFEKLHTTLAEEFGIDFDVRPVKDEDSDFLIARCDDPQIRIMNADSNEGVQWLSRKSSRSRHWFAFVDPQGLTVQKETLDSLIDRGNVDILLNYQTTGVMRNAADGAPGHSAVEDTMGDRDWNIGMSSEEAVREMEGRLRERGNYDVTSKKCVSPRDPGYRFDLIFSCANETAISIMDDILECEEFWSKAYDEIGQTGLETF
jgi:three-Cys-motif partner protein